MACVYTVRKVRMHDHGRRLHAAAYLFSISVCPVSSTVIEVSGIECDTARVSRPAASCSLLARLPAALATVESIVRLYRTFAPALATTVRDSDGDTGHIL